MCFLNWHAWIVLPFTDCARCHETLCRRCFAVRKSTTVHEDHLVLKAAYR